MSLNETLTDNIIRKLEELSKNYEKITKAKIVIKQRNTAACDHAFCEIELHLPNFTILSKSLAKNFDIAVDKTIRKLKIELLKKGIPKWTSKTRERFYESGV